MINQICTNIKDFLSRKLDVFDRSSTDVQVKLHKNRIEVSGMNGEYTLSGIELNDKGLNAIVNSTHVFENGLVKTNYFISEDEKTLAGKARKLEIGHAFQRNIAIEMITHRSVKNRVVVYLADVSSLERPEKGYPSASSDLGFKVVYNLGVFFKIESSMFKSKDATYYDNMFVNSVLFGRQDGISMPKFEGIRERMMEGDSCVIEMDFSYQYNMLLEKDFMAGVKNYPASIEALKL